MLVICKDEICPWGKLIVQEPRVKVHLALTLWLVADLPAYRGRTGACDP